MKTTNIELELELYVSSQLARLYDVKLFRPISSLRPLFGIPVEDQIYVCQAGLLASPLDRLASQCIIPSHNLAISRWVLTHAISGCYSRQVSYRQVAKWQEYIMKTNGFA